MKKYIFFIVCSFCYSHFAFAQWEKQYVTLSGQNLISVSFADSIHGWAVGAFGTIFKYDGIKWSFQSSGTTSDLNSVFFLDKNTGWAVGGYVWNREILKYDGDTWLPQTNFSQSDLGLLSVHFIDKNHGWAVGYGGSIIKYDGSQWLQQSSGTTHNLNSVYFTDVNNGWAVGQSTILKYNGTSWSVQTYDIPYNLTSVYFTAENSGWAIGYDESTSNQRGIILKYDGTSWTPVDLLLNDIPLSITFSYSNSGWIVCKSGAILKFENDQWKTSQQGDYCYDLNDVCFTDPNTGWAVGTTGTILRFDGYNWTRPYDGATDFNFTSMIVGKSWGNLVVGNGYNLAGDQCATFFDNLCDYWCKRPFYWNEEIGVHYNSISSPNDTLSFLVGGSADTALFHEMIASYIYSQSYSYNWPEYQSVSFYSANDGWISGSNSYLRHLHRNNLWFDWYPAYYGVNEDIYSLCFLRENRGWAIGSSYNEGYPNSEILKYDGMNWSSLYKDSTHLKFNSVLFTDDYQGFAVGDYNNQSSVILQTLDQGVTWDIVYTDTTTALKYINCKDAYNCWVVGTRGKIIRYDGETWSQQNSGTDKDLNCVKVNGYYEGWVVGNEGTILHTFDARITGEEEDRIKTTTLTSNILPNPFELDALVIYELPKPSQVILTIYDMNGREKLQLVNEVQNMGKHVVHIPGAGLSSGVYFYRLQTNQSTESRKIIKL
jgi:photosystem II stability/assembly factor-like uncharacterized protein